jgi:hypothetical protein
MLKIPDAVNLATGQKWYTCALCGASYDEMEMVFTSGSTLPVEDETLTGATSGATAVVDNVKLISGTWAGGDAAGVIWCTAPSAFDFDTGHWGTSGENINGSTAGSNCLTMVLYGNKKSYGRYYPEGETVERDGKILCTAHDQARYSFRDKDEQRIEISEETDE